MSERQIKVCESVEYEAPESLSFLADNPRTELTKQKARKLDASLLSLGLFRPLLVWRGPENEDPPMVIGGNKRLTRLRALLDAGCELDGPGIPVTTYRGDEASARLVALRDNVEEADWDWDKLSAYTADLDSKLDVLASGLTLELSGFSTDVLADLQMNLGTASELPQVGPEPTGKKGKGKSRGSLSDDSMAHVSVRIGHIRGKVEAATYKRLSGALAVQADADSGAGLDTAFNRLLDLAGINS